MKLGKKPARPGAVRLALRAYINRSVLPTPPAEFGHDNLVTDWGMLGNDSYGCCVWAGAAHETMMWNREAGNDISFGDANVLADYAAVTGFDPNNPASDQGTDMQAAAAYRQKTGVVDAAGNRHKVGPYLAITAGDLEEHLIAAYLFGAVGLGVAITQANMDQFSAGQPWDTVTDQVEGGHYIPFVARRGGLSVVVTWGKEQQMTDAWFATANDESIVYLSPEMLSGGKSLDGFDLDQLQADLASLTA